MKNESSDQSMNATHESAARDQSEAADFLNAQTEHPDHSKESENHRVHVVLVEPEIPNNTGNIGRTCVTTGCKLHLVKPLGFDIDEKACRRAGLDYWPRLDLEEHESIQDYVKTYPPKSGKNKTWFLTTKASQSVYDAPIEPGDHLVFGCESAGLDDTVHEAYPDQRICVPMVPDERSLNLSTCVAIVVYEVVRKMIVSGASRVTDDGRLVSGDS